MNNDIAKRDSGRRLLSGHNWKRRLGIGVVGVVEYGGTGVGE